ncbi:MAG TPA: peptide chain release factor N(5)-glutamine methyltransferase [Terriglobales bacterium]|nr:peptide chain release factor N(5)-glutamine methyltransferase [Terriglobales bacterium]
MTDSVDIASLLARASSVLAAAGIDGAGREARLILQHAAAIPVATQIAFSERQVAADAVMRFDQAVARRRQREPLSHILGYREFWSLSFHVTADTLDPRADSETLVECVLDELKKTGTDWQARDLRLIDFGTGTGCLLLALLSELPRARGLGIDLNPGAVTVARENAARLGLADRAHFQEGNWDQGLTESFDVVISNPPYIPSADIAGLQPEVARYEPHLALDGGNDGLSAYRSLAEVLQRRMKPGGIAALEIGAGQGQDVVALMQQAGLQHVREARDLQGHERIVVLHKS